MSHMPPEFLTPRCMRYCVRRSTTQRYASVVCRIAHTNYRRTQILCPVLLSHEGWIDNFQF